MTKAMGPPLLAAEVTRLLERRYREICERAAKIPPDDDRESEKWDTLLIEAEIDARDALLRAVLSWNPEFDVLSAMRPEKRRWPSRGLLLGDRLYLALEHPSASGLANPRPGDLSGVDLMYLVAVDVASIHRVEGGPL